MFFFFFFNDTATTEIYTLSLHDALPISIVKNLLSFARSQEGERIRQPIRTLLDSTLVLLRNQLMAHKVEATVEVEAGPAGVVGKSNQSQQGFVYPNNNRGPAHVRGAPIA